MFKWTANYVDINGETRSISALFGLTKVEMDDLFNKLSRNVVRRGSAIDMGICLKEILKASYMKYDPKTHGFSKNEVNIWLKSDDFLIIFLDLMGDDQHIRDFCYKLFEKPFKTNENKKKRGM